MDVLAVSVMLLMAGYTDLDTLDESALDIVNACGIGPTSEPSGRACHAAAIAIWSTETRRQFQRYPKAITGCGPMQVIQPKSGFKNTRIGHQVAPPCTGLRVPSTGFLWGVRVLRWKKQRTRSMLTAFRYYNGSGDLVTCGGVKRKRMFCYARTAYKLYRSIL